MKRRHAFVLGGIILLAGAILYETRPPAATGPSPIITPELTYTRAHPLTPPMNADFLDNIQLSLDAPVKTSDPDSIRARLNLQNNLPAAGYDRLQPRPGGTTKTAFTLEDRQLNYELFGSQDFALKLSLKAVYANPEALLPTRLDPALGVSVKF
jgi:hypothetical protein